MMVYRLMLPLVETASDGRGQWLFVGCKLRLHALYNHRISYYSLIAFAKKLLAAHNMSVLSVSLSSQHSFGKSATEWIYLLEGLGVQDDVHCAHDHDEKNLRQVHLIDSSLFSSLAKPDKKGRTYKIIPGALGENITTKGIDLIGLDEGTRLHFGSSKGHAIIRITGLRNPKKRLDQWPAGILDGCVLKDKKGAVVGRKIGVMGVVESDGYVQPEDKIYIEPPKVHKSLKNI